MSAALAWPLLAAALMPLLFTGIAKVRGAGFDNADPRAWQSRLSGLPQRAHAAHLNSFEAFPLFAVGVLMAHVTQTYGVLVDVLAVTFVVSRVLYLLCYWYDLHWQRSLIWVVGLLCSLLLMLSPAL